MHFQHGHFFFASNRAQKTDFPPIFSNRGRSDQHDTNETTQDISIMTIESLTNDRHSVMRKNKRSRRQKGQQMAVNWSIEKNIASTAFRHDFTPTQFHFPA